MEFEWLKAQYVIARAFQDLCLKISFQEFQDGNICGIDPIQDLIKILGKFT